MNRFKESVKLAMHSFDQGTKVIQLAMHIFNLVEAAWFKMMSTNMHTSAARIPSHIMTACSNHREHQK